MNEAYGKPLHILVSPAVFLDLDSLIYILEIATLIWFIIFISRKVHGRHFCNFGIYISKYMILSSLPIFLLYLVQLIMSGQFSLNNWIICFLPIVYAALIQLIARISVKAVNGKKNKKTL